jgi:hexosaminidase
LTRDQRSVEYMLFPRLLAFAERAWHQAEWEGKLSQAAFLPALNRDFSEFTQVVAKRHYSRLVKADINVRIPPPGYQIDAHHQLELRAAMPNLKLEYSADAMTWHTYTGAVSADNIHFVRARLINSPHTSRIIAVEP